MRLVDAITWAVCIIAILEWVFRRLKVKLEPDEVRTIVTLILFPLAICVAMIWYMLANTP